MVKFIGRRKERAILEKALESAEAEMVAVIGRRRVGKIFLINTVYGHNIDFEITGIENTPLQLQLKNFAYQLSEAAGEPVERPSNWFDAFVRLIAYLKTKQGERKSIVFFDELPWIVSEPDHYFRLNAE